MDKGDTDPIWDVVKIIDHATRRVTRRLPRGKTPSETVKDKHIRLLALFGDGDNKWVSMDAVLLQDPIPVMAYLTKNNLIHRDKFKQVKDMMHNTESMECYRRAFKAKVDKAPVYHFGVEIPRSPIHAKLLDMKNGNNSWNEANKKEMKSINEHQVFRLATPKDDMRQYKRIPYQIIYACKHDGRRKARLVAGGHMTAPPTQDIYSGVVGMDTMRLAFAVGAMQKLDVCACDISTAFLYGTTREKVYVVAGPEFGPEMEGKKLIIQGNLYGLKSASAVFHSVASECMRKMGFRPTKVDADLYMRKKDDHYEYLALYVDDVLAWGKDPLKIVEEIKGTFKLRGIGFPDYYLGADVKKIEEKHLQDDGVVLGISARTYIQNTLEKLSKLLDGGPFHKAKSPMMDSYHSELDDTPILNEINASKYRALIGSANWVVTLGRFDVAYATSNLARYSIQPREGHLIALKRVFGYLRTFPSGETLVNTRKMDHSEYKSELPPAWTEFYPDAGEVIPTNAPEPLKMEGQITIYVDADHAHDVVTRRSVTGIMVFINRTLVRYISKRQKTVETSTYGSELVAARIATEIAMEYRYALRMLGIQVNGPCQMFGDNNSVVLNTTLPSSMLKKKHNSVAYHMVREAVAGKIIKFNHIPSEENYADVLTKPLPPAVFHRLVRPILFIRSGSPIS